MSYNVTSYSFKFKTSWNIAYFANVWVHYTSLMIYMIYWVDNYLFLYYYIKLATHYLISSSLMTNNYILLTSIIKVKNHLRKCLIIKLNALLPIIILK